MTREEAIRQLQSLREHCRSMIRNEYEDGIWVQDIEALDLALSALRPVSREQVEKVWKGEWQRGTKDWGCSRCGRSHTFVKSFCPNCGAPMTDEAVEMVMERMETIR